MSHTAPGQHWLDRSEGRRLFVAVPLGEAARAEVGALMADIGYIAPGAPRPKGVAVWGGPRTRWVRPETLHVTMRFLGATPDDDISGLRSAVDEAASGCAAFRVRLDGAGAYPTAHRPRVLWIGLGDGAERLAQLATGLEDALAVRGWPRDDRPFAAHLTIARTDGVATAGVLANDLRARAEGLDASWTADRLVLFESITGGGPARYEPLHEAKLRA